jgi:hypothetical protein
MSAGRVGMCGTNIVVGPLVVFSVVLIIGGRLGTFDGCG